MPDLHGDLKAEIDRIERPAETRTALRRAGRFDPADLDGCLADGGYSGWKKALTATPEAIIDELGRSGLRGRGGVGFPVAEKWRACREASAGEKVVVCNAAETDPSSSAGRILLEEDPHAVLEGMMIGARAMGAGRGVLVVNPAFGRALERFRGAMAAAEARGLTGAFRMEIVPAPEGLVGGEETALLHYLEGKPPLPAPRPPLPSPGCLTVNGRPALIHHVETWAHVSAVLEMGVDRGTKIFTLSGSVRHPGVVEVPLGTAIRRIVFEIGGGAPEGRHIKAVRFGGPAGGFLPPEALDVPATYEHLAEAGVGLGSGGLVAVDDGACLVDLTREALSIMRKETCGVCVFGREAVAQLGEILNDITQGRGAPRDLDLLQELAEGLRLGALCPVCAAAAGPVLTGLKYFRPEFEAHARDQRCPSGACDKSRA